MILTKDVEGLGRTGDVKEVSDGHARNFLIPKHFALPATSSVLARVQKEAQERVAKIAKDQGRLLDFKKKLENRTITIKAKADKTHLFAAIHEKDIADAVNAKLGVEINPDIIKLKEPIKTLGLHSIEIRFAKDQVALVQLQVEAV